MIVYFDSSALVKMVMGEEGRDLALEAWGYARLRVTSCMAYPEARAALAAAERSGRIGAAAHKEAAIDLDGLFASMQRLDVDRELARRAGALADAHALKGGDAIHLSSMLGIDAPRVVAATWDKRMALAASKNGLGVVPEPPRWEVERADGEVGPPNRMLV